MPTPEIETDLSYDRQNHLLDIYNESTCKTKAEEDRERAAPITIASSTVLIFTWNSFKPNKLKKK